MAQCKKILASGQRCSNQAVPGLEVCERHRRPRVKFQKVPEVADVPPPVEKAAKKAASRPTWAAQPAAAGAPVSFPGLQRGARRILVADEGLIWLGQAGSDQRPEPLSLRLERLLAALSQTMALAGQVAVQFLPAEQGALVALTPQGAIETDLAGLYDVAANAAAFSGGLLYVGQDRTFIQYRDGSAPLGYDAADVTVPPDDNLYLIDRTGTHQIARQALTPASLDKILLAATPVSSPGQPRPHQAYVLAAPPLYRLLARYFSEHRLQFEVARFFGGQPEQTYLLFRLTPQPDAPAEAAIPAFILAYLAALPRTAVLTDQGAADGRQLLVQWRYRHPAEPAHIVSLFPANSLSLVTAAPEFPNLTVTPAPTFFAGDQLLRVEARRPLQTAVTPLKATDRLALEIPLRLVHDRSAPSAPAALVLDQRDLAWTRQLLYRLPGEAFGRYQLCVGDGQAVLLATQKTVENLPFGLPLRRVQDSHLFIPVHTRLAPALPWPLLAETLALADDTYTFFTGEFRLDIPRQSFTPLSKALVSQLGRRRVSLELQPAPALPPLRWQPPASPDPSPAPAARPEPALAPAKPSGFLQRLFGGGAAPPSDPIKPPLSPADDSEVESPDMAATLRQKAQEYLAEDDLLGAGLCYTVLGDTANAARCFERAVSQMSS